MPTKVIPSIPIGTNPLYLAGVGMRRKNLYVVDVDVYLVGINVSASSLGKAREWKVSTANNKSLTDALLDNNNTKEKTKVGATLRFVRGVTSSQIVEAFNDAFSDLSVADIAAFKQSMREVLTDGVKQGEEFQFYWMADGSLLISKDRKIATVQSTAISKRLLEVYVEPNRTVSKELADCVLTHLKEIEM